LAKGMSDSLYLDRSDILELNEARTIVGDYLGAAYPAGPTPFEA
jgi:hypothetical protein